MWRFSAAIGATCALLAPSAALAQASIAGVVKDTSGAVLPGVTVEASSPALSEKVRSVATDGTGQYRIENLRPGVYTVTFTLPGFSTVKREGVELTGSFTASVNADMRVGALEETITVTGETPIVDVQNTTRQRVMDHDVIDVIPSGKSERNLAVLIPGVTLSGGQDVGGALTNVQGSLTVHGSRGTDQRITQNGVTLGVSQGGGQASAVLSNMAAFQEVAVDTAAATAEQATGGVRINFIPKDGGNTFSGSFFASFANNSLQGDNYTQALKDRGLRAPSTIKKLFDINPGFGGPFKKDKLWFYASVRYYGAFTYPADIFNNLNANNPNLWTYVPDTSHRPSNDSTWKDGSLRLTWQATSRNKFGFSWNQQENCYCPENISATTAPEAGVVRVFPVERNLLADWTSPVTSRLLLEASLIRRVENASRRAPDEAGPAMIAVTDQALGNLVYRAPSGTLRQPRFKTLYYRGALSYVTGAHAFKVGFTGGRAFEDTANTVGTQPYNYRFNNGVPNQVTLFATPIRFLYHVDQDSGVYAQDKWTVHRLTVSYGIRYDEYRSSFPDTSLGPGPLVPTRNLTFPETPGITWRDLTPKSGLSYDVLGNGKTAVKVSLNKYLQGQGSGDIFGAALAPVSLLVTSTTRSWNDANRNFVPDCDLASPLVNGECGAMANPNFGKAVPGNSYDPDTLTGWGKRPYNWEFSVGVQHQVLPRVSVDLSYFRRWYGNFIVTDNRAVAASDFTTFSVTTPTSDPRLPTAGRAITGLYDLVPTRFGLPSDNFITYADKYGMQVEHWNGIDLTVNARPRAGMLMAGGVSVGRTLTDVCEIAAAVPESLFGATILGNANSNVWLPLQYCRQQSPFQAQVKLIGAYTVPRIGVQVSGAFQSLPGPLVAANYNAPNAAVAGSLGRSLSGSAANISVNLVEPGSMYGERMNQLDLRVAKILRLGRARTGVNLDLYNLFNSNAVLTQNNTFAGATPWQQPQSILLPRFAKVSVQVDF